MAAGGTVVALLAGFVTNVQPAAAQAASASAGTHSTSRAGAPLRHASITRGTPVPLRAAPLLRHVTTASGAAETEAEPADVGADGPMQPVLITFSELPDGSSVSDQYQAAGIDFGGDSPFITDDGANPTSPVLSGTPRFEGTVEGAFVTPEGAPRTVSGFSLDVGYIDDPGSVEVVAVDASGNPLVTVPANALGIVRVNVNHAGIAGFQVQAVSEEDAGFAVDNVSFAGWASVTGGPAVDEQGGDTNPSEHPTTCYAAKPVNCATGDFFHQFDDVAVPGRGVPLDLYRTYDAADAGVDGPFGYGWSDSYGMTLTTGPDGTVSVSQENGSVVSFTPDGSGGYTAPTRVLATLTAGSDGTWQFVRRSTGDAYTFSASGQLLSEADRNGETTTLGYSGSELSTVTDPAGRTLTFTWSGSHIVKVTDPMSRPSTYTYDAGGNLASATDRAGRTWRFAYSAAHLLTTMTDPRGATLTNTYDAQNRVTTQTDEAGLLTQWAYLGDPASATGATTTMTDPHGAVTVYEYTDLELVAVTHGAGTAAAATTYYAYDPATLGRTEVIDPDGATTTSGYDADGNLLSSTDPTGATTAYQYNSDDEVTLQQTPLDYDTSYSYDDSGNLTETDYPDGSSIDTHGDAAHPGDVTTVTDPDGRPQDIGYDSYGDVSSITVHPEAGTDDVTSYRYDADGERVCTASADAHAAGHDCPAAGASPVPGTSTTTYDADGLPTSVTDPDAGAVPSTYAYDADTDRTSVTDPLGHVTKTTYDGDGRALTVTKGSGGSAPSTTGTNYDVAPGVDGCTGSGVLYCTVTTDATGGTSVDGYNALDELVTTSQPGQHATTYTYDSAGDRISRTDAAGRTTTYGYDADRRQVSVAYPDASTPDVSYTYDLDGNRTSMTDGTGLSTYAYDARDRLIQEQDGTGDFVGYSVDPSGDVTSITYPGGQDVQRTFDGAGRMDSVTDWLGGETTFAHDADGNLTGTVYPNGDQVSNAFDAADQESSTAVSTTATGTVLASVGYTRDADAQVTTEKDAGALAGTTAYTYDDQGRLTAAQSTAYSYDLAGDATTFGKDAQTFDAAQEITSSTTGTTGTDYQYDALGERTSSTPVTNNVLGDPTRYGYDDEGRLVTVQKPVLTVTKVAPSAGPAAGGTTVTLTGTGFTGATAVDFGTKAATSFTVVSATSITAKAPQGTGTVDITVVTPLGTSATSTADHYTYQPLPTVTKVSPTTGLPAGGTAVTLTGTGFTGTTAVHFDTKAATSFTVASSTSIVAKSPAGTGVVDVRVTTGSGTSAATATDHFAYFLQPTVAKLSVGNGPTSGGTSLTITGTGLSGAKSVRFGTTSVKPTASTSSTVTVHAPAHAAGVLDVTVTTAHGTSAKTKADQYTYISRPVVSKVSPTSGSTAGGTTVTVTGHNLSGATTVHFGTKASTKVTVVSSTKLTARSPSGTGTVDITVTTRGGTSAKATADHFGYKAPKTAHVHGHAQAHAGDLAADLPPAGETDYTYDGDGLRTAKTTAAGTEAFVWGTGAGAAQLLADGPLDFVYGPNGQVIEQIDASTDQPTVQYYFTDTVGSTRALLAQDGTVSATYRYDAYGTLVAKTGAAATPLQYGGGYADSESGFLFLMHRYYDPATGQFVAVDPAVDDTQAPYDYADDNPVNLADPTGMWGWNPVSWVVNHAGDISAVTGTLAVVLAPIPGVDAVSLVLGGISVATGIIATGHDISEGNYGQAVVDGAGTMLGGAGMVEDVGARLLQSAARDAWDAGEPVLDLARQSEQWEARGALTDRVGAGAAIFGDWTDHEKFFGSDDAPPAYDDGGC
jgi:RHS repeat-associated protein